MIVYCDGSGTGLYGYYVPSLGVLNYGKRENITHNEAEYHAIILALEDYPNSNMTIYTDSLLVVNQYNGTYKVKDPKMKYLLSRIRELSRNRRVEILYIRRKHNLADRILRGYRC